MMDREDLLARELVRAAMTSKGVALGHAAAFAKFEPVLRSVASLMDTHGTTGAMLEGAQRGSAAQILAVNVAFRTVCGEFGIVADDALCAWQDGPAGEQIRAIEAALGDLLESAEPDLSLAERHAATMRDMAVEILGAP